MSESTKIGRYIVQSMLGEGAMGSVYKALDPAIKRTVAIKTVKLDQSRNQKDANEFYERFMQEAQISGTLHHPNIVSIFDIGWQDQVPYIAMEYVEGKTLSDFLHGDPKPSMGHLIQIIIQISNALDFAHNLGIVHRDLKPSNIMVMENGTAKIMDFGIAKRSGTNLTQTGVFLGTPSYSSPEQIREGHVDHRSDIFSFGILAHETLTGHLPFPGSTINAILYKIANEPPVPAPNLNTLSVDIPSWRQVFNMVLDKDPDKRYQRASKFAHALFRSLSLSQKERSAAAQLLGQPSTMVRDLYTVQKDLKRSDFEMAQPTIRTIPPQAGKRRNGLWVSLVLFLGLIGALGYLHQTKKLAPLLAKINITLPGFAAETTITGSTAAGQPLRLNLRSNPSGAMISQNATLLGKTPLDYDWAGKEGETLELVFSLDGYNDAIHTLAFAPDIDPKIQAVLTQKTEAFPVKSEPSGAEVSLDGKSMGVTPMELALIPGKAYKIRVTKEGFLSQDISFKAGETGTDVLDLQMVEAPKPGLLKLETDIDDLKISLNGRNRSGSSISLEPGTYRVNLSSSKYFYNDTQQITIKSGQTETLRTPPIITISRIEFIGGYVKVKIDGQFVKNNGQIDTTPLIDLKIVAGTHTFEFIDQDEKIVAEQKREVQDGDGIIVALDP